MRYAIVQSKFNATLTDGLLLGALETFSESGIDRSAVDVYLAPGAFEIPLLAQTLALQGKYAGIVCLGCVIKGETAHFEYISQAASVGIMQAQLATQIPMSFGILTTYNETQALARSVPGPENKGREAALACIAQVRALSEIR